MFKKQDPSTFSKFSTLLDGTTVVGTAATEFQVSNYDDVQLADFNSLIKSKQRKFLVHCTQRIRINNPDGANQVPRTFIDVWLNYPALLQSLVTVTPQDGVTVQLMDYSPKTINSKVQTSGTSGGTTGQTTGSTNSNTVGSITSETNSYGASVSLDGGSANYEHSTTNTQEQSHTSGSESSNSSNKENSNTASMSIKDWGAYSMIDPATQSPSWVFGQEYPWDVIQCKNTDGASFNPFNQNQVVVAISDEMAFRLWDTYNLYPPSQLSLFGLNFVMKAQWLITLEDTAPDDISIAQTLSYFTASHTIPAQATRAFPFIDKAAKPLAAGINGSLNSALNLPLIALDPISQSTPSVIGFIPNKFILKPQPAGSSAAIPFKINSTSNNLMILDTTSYPSGSTGGGFTSSETYMSASIVKTCPALQLTAYFKVIDTVNNYSLYMKHWKIGDAGCMLTIVINGDTDNPITKYVDAQEAEGGENNLLSISLRNQDYASIDYHDYLQLGLNSIQINVLPVGGTYSTDITYGIRAISIEKD